MVRSARCCSSERGRAGPTCGRAQGYWFPHCISHRGDGRDFKQFKDGSQFGAWLGLTRRQNSSGGKTSLGGITKRGNTYLRTLLVQGAKAAVLTGKHNDDPISEWAQSLRQRCGWQKAVVALANKNARILWAVMTREKRYDAHHVSVPSSAAMSVVA